ncbi:hypothetical protein LNV08_09180 [Paucibacter sp. TC2R-5]|uniref:hypothetical protein n=1 Tax=Paucibacter sp. TC2R-5 TaxID=2893555 RepID=UPI0021E4182A|nr:hypothetical protein [Paucibacter sp. TC2R-5]MCV2359148.1 hypothetical protein [Paucibacter sp. TC2R-5]
MNIKQNLIAGACLAVCSAASFAAVTPLTCPAVVDQATAQTFVKNCAVGQTIFIGGASTLKSNTTTLINNLFDTSVSNVVKINDQGSVSGKRGNVVAFFGMSKAALTGGTSKPLLAIYNFNNGSAAGVSQLYGKPALIAEADVVTVGSTKNVANALCSTTVAIPGFTDTDGSVVPEVKAGTDAAPAVTCTSHAAQQADVAISDVRAQELYAVYDAAAKGKASDLTGTPLFSQSFGVNVSWPLYTALQAKNGLTVGSTAAADQPSITKAEYASLVSKTGAIKSLAALTGNSALTAPLTLARRDDLSGTQAASNIFFVNGQCGGNGRQLVAKSVDQAVAKAGGLGGGLAIVEKADSTDLLKILSASVSQNVKDATASTTDYAIGVLNVGGGGQIAANKANFVKIDGISPTYYGGAVDSRTGLIKGEYPFAVTSYAYTVTKAMAKAPEKAALAKAVIDGFKSSAQLNGGLAYFDGFNAAVQAKAKRAGDNNCSPISKL